MVGCPCIPDEVKDRCVVTELDFAYVDARGLVLFFFGHSVSLKIHTNIRILILASKTFAFCSRYQALFRREHVVVEQELEHLDVSTDHAKINAWMRECVVDAWMRGCADTRMRGCVDAWMRGCVDAWMRRCVDA
jgi:hypothetical protein